MITSVWGATLGRRAPSISSAPSRFLSPLRAGGQGAGGGGEGRAEQQAGVVVGGAGAPVSVLGNEIRGLGSTDTVRQDGVVVRDGARATVQGNQLADLHYSRADDVACGLRLAGADGVRQDRDRTVAVERPLCNAGRGGGNPGV